MATFAILSRAGAAAATAISAAFPDHHIWSNEVAFVRAAGSAKEVSEKLGVQHQGPDGTIAGTLNQTVVVEVSPNYWGFTEQTLWAWLKNSFEAGR